MVGRLPSLGTHGSFDAYTPVDATARVGKEREKSGVDGGAPEEI